jgi:undecaprenyl-diphosphatase
MNILGALLLGIIEGVTEFLPISSTAHLTLTSELLGMPQSDFLKTFIIVVQLGAIVPVLWLYFKKYRKDRRVHARVLAGFVPTAVIGFVLYKLIKSVFLGNIPLLITTLGGGGILILILEIWLRKAPQSITAKGITQEISLHKAIVIGCCQALAVVPGVSRSAATVMGGLLMGISRATIVEFTFILAVPTMLAASSYDILKNYHLFTQSNVGVLLVGFVSAAIVAKLSISFLLSFVRKYTFIPFAVYRMVLAGIVALVLFA